MAHPGQSEGHDERLEQLRAESAGTSATPDHYATLLAWYSGSWHSMPGIRQSAQMPSLYRNTRQVWRQASAIVNLYDQFCLHG
jgi:hypothetical protein